MNETPKLWPQAWSLIRGQQRPALAGLVLTILSIAASLLQPWPLKIIVDSILGTVPMPAWLGVVRQRQGGRACWSCASRCW